ncbi:MAG: YgeY family selenium metabolism-linked hydrolase [Caldisericia bacterium]|nr:YgeY family selenium metabolism-linked hydrolase [Caldisericia bacterium]
MCKQDFKKIIDQDGKDMLAFAQRLIQLPSVTGQEGDVAGAIVSEMKRLNYDKAFCDEAGNVIGVISGTGGGEHILYNCHMDQVDPGNLNAWEYPPFEGIIANGWIHGRGASDTKGAIAAQVYAAAAVKKLGVPHEGDIIVTAVVEEEPGDMWGMRKLVDNVISDYHGKIGLLVLGEATGLNIYLGHRGKVEIDIRTLGKVAHSSAPWRGANAIYKMRPIIQSIENLSDRLPEHPLLRRSSVAITNISCSPGWLSTVPDVCTIRIDRRFLPSENRETILLDLERIINSAGLDVGRDAFVDIQKYHHVSYSGLNESMELYKPAFLTSEDEPHVRAVSRSLEAVGQKPTFDCWDFGTDGAWVATELGIPTIGYSPCEEEFAHTPKDRISIDLMEKSVYGYISISIALTRKE